MVAALDYKTETFGCS